MQNNPSIQRIFALFFTVYVVFSLILIVWAPFDFYPKAPEKYAMNDVLFQQTENTVPTEIPLDGYEPIALPDDWKGEDRAPGAWYMANWIEDGEGLENVYAVYIPRVFQNAAVWVNGHWVGQGGAFKPLSHGWNKPQLYEFDRDLLRTGNNDIAVFMAGYVADDNLISKIYVGPKSELKPVWKTMHAIHVDGVQFAANLVVFLAIFMALLWLLRSKDSVYGWLALSCVAVWIDAQNFVVTELPISYPVWQATIFAAQGWSIVFLVMSCFRVLNKPDKRVEYLMIGSTVLGVLTMLGLLLFFPANLMRFLFVFWNFFSLAIGFYAFGRMLVGTLRSKHINHLSILLFPTSFTVICAIRDNLVLAGVFDRELPLFHFYAFFSILVTHSLLLVIRVVRSFDESERLNRELEQRVADKQNELSNNYEKMAQMEKDRAISSERERIMQDMHDGVGGQLVGTLNLLSTPDANFSEVKSRIKESVTDLRMMIDSLDPEITQWQECLRVIELRYERQLSSMDVTLLWSTEGETSPRLLPKTVLQVMRVMQEILNNIVKHSQADEVDVLVISQPSGIEIVVQDNGVGAAHFENGRGLLNMQRRASALGAEIEIDLQPPGSRIRLSLSLDNR